MRNSREAKERTKQRVAKQRWIVPIQSTGRVEISITATNLCKIQLFDVNKSSDGSGGYLNLDELRDLIPFLVYARNALEDMKNSDLLETPKASNPDKTEH